MTATIRKLLRVFHDSTIMRAQYRSLALFTFLGLLVWHTLLGPEMPLALTSSELDRLATNSEALFAVGRKVPLQCADMYDLELIPGISDKFSSRIEQHKREIMAAALRLPVAQRHTALEIVHGIGPKSALAFSRWIDLSPMARCPSKSSR